MRTLQSLIIILLATTVAFAGRPVGHWDVVANQRISAPFKAGVVAFHPEGLKVEFRVNGALVHTANDPTLNDRVNVWEFWFTLDPSAYADGPVTLDATAIPLNGTDPVYDLASLNLYTNSGGSLDEPTVTWADSVNGSDANPGTEAEPYQTLNKAVDNTPAGGTVYLKAGTYSPDAINAGVNRAYWTTVAAAPGLGWDDVEISSGRPKTDKLKLQNLSLFTTSTSGGYTLILTGETGSTTIWLDNVKTWNKNGRYAAETAVFGNGYSSYVTGGLTTQTTYGPSGRIVRDHQVQSIASDVFSGNNRLVVNCTVDDVDRGTTSAHPDFHQAYVIAPSYCENMVMYNVKAFNMNCQGFYGLRLKDSAFVNVLFERVPDVDFLSQYSNEMINDMWFHVTLVSQVWKWRGLGASALAATDVKQYNCVFSSMMLIEDASATGLDIDTNHFVTSSLTMGTNITTGDPLYTDPAAEDYSLQADSPAFRTGRRLQCVPADIDGVPYNTTRRNKGCFSGPPSLTADAGDDQTVLDREGDGAEDVILDGTGSSEPVGTITGYLWEEDATQLAAESLARVNLDVGTHTITLTVTNDSAATDIDTVTVTVEALTGPMQRLSLGYIGAPRFAAPTALVWPANPGEADICLWEDDKFAAASISIDDNVLVDHSWWNGLTAQYGWNFTWFVVTGGVELGSNPAFNGSWADWNAMFALGQGVESHTWSHHSDDDVRPEAEVIVQYRDSLDVIRQNIPGNDPRFFAWPYGNYNADIAKIYTAGARGVSGGPNRAQSINYLNTNSGSGDCGPNYVNCVLDGTSGISWMNNSDWLRGWMVSHFHQVNNKPEVEADLAYLASRESELWIGLFGDVATYGQQRDTATLTVTVNTASQIAFTLSDEMDDTVYDYPLTVKVKLYPGWGDFNATQNGSPIEATVVDHNGENYALVKAVPDQGVVVLALDDGANLIPTAHAGTDQTVVDADENGGEAVTLDGSGSLDTDGSIIGYSWEENTSVIAAGVSPTVTLDVNVHTIVLTVVDDEGASDTDSVVITVAAPVAGQTYTIYGHSRDTMAQSTLTTRYFTEDPLRVGGNTTSTDAAGVYVFKLPTLEAGETIVTANLDVHLVRVAGTPSGAVDLYGLGYREASTVLGTDFYQGDFDGDATDAWALQDDIAVNPMASDSIVSTDADADAALAAYLTAQYEAGAQGEEYVFLRFNCDVANQGSYCYWLFTSANGATAPVLTIQTGDPAAPAIDGDADGDGDVDLDDFVILKINFGTSTGATQATGDFDGDGDVDLDDFVILKINFGS